MGILISAAVLIFTSSCRQGSEQPATGGGSQGGEVAPEIGALTPASGTGRTATLQVSVSHPAGAAAIADIQVLIDEKMTATGSGACWIDINSSKFVAVRNEESTGFLPGVVIGSTGIAADTKCSVPAAGVKLEPKDTEVVVTLPITFAPTFKGPKKIYVIASTARKNCPWKERGAWTVEWALRRAEAQRQARKHDPTGLRLSADRSLWSTEWLPMQSTVRSLPSASAPVIIPWRPIAWFLCLLVLCYAPVLRRLTLQWYQDEDMGHGFFVPLVAAYIAWQSRRELLAEGPSPNWWGLLVVAYGAFQLMIATLGAELFLARTAFIISLAGAILTVGGTRYLRILAFPLFLLCFMVPIPAVIYNRITFPMQLFASRVADNALTILGIPVLREGNILELASQRLNVVEACSGIRSLLSLSFLSLVYAWFFDKKVWMRAVLLVATLPIAIIANAGRVTLTGVVSEYNTELAGGIFHFASGWVIFMVAMAILILFHQLLNLLYRRLHAKS